MPLWGSIADDLTGATDLATNFVSRGYATTVVFGSPALPDIRAVEDDAAGADVVVVALKSRTAPVDEAVSTSLAATGLLRRLGAERFYVKYCSTFDSTPRGNIGPVTDAVMHALGATQTIVVPAFPATGRVVEDGELLVNGVPLDESPMKDHPLTPMRDSSVPRLLRPQTAGRVELIDLHVVRAGVNAVRAQLHRLDGPDPSLVVIDAVTDEDLAVIAAASAHLPVVTGGSGLALGLDAAPATADPRRIPIAGGRRAVLCGSASEQTRAQVRYAKSRMPWRKLDADALATDPARVVADVSTWASAVWDDDPDATPLVFSVDDLADVRRAGPGASDRVEEAMAAIARRFVDSGVRRLIVAGGETSGRVVGALGVRSLRIGPEIAPGVAWASGRDGDDLLLNLALKSGNFGAESMFASAWEDLA